MACTVEEFYVAHFIGILWFFIFVFNSWNRRCCCPAGQHTQLLCCDNIMLDLQWVFSHGAFLVFTKIAKTTMNVMVVVIQEFI